MATAHTAVRLEGNTAGRLPDGTASRFNATADDCECCDDDDDGEEGGVPGVICDPCIYEVESLDITISGIANDVCGDCTDLNGVTFNIPRIDELSCGGEEVIANPNECGTVFLLEWFIQYATGPDRVLIDITLYEDDDANVLWTKSIPVEDGFTIIDCSQFNGSFGLPNHDFSSADCDWSAATVSVVVNNEAAPP